MTAAQIGSPNSLLAVAMLDLNGVLCAPKIAKTMKQSDNAARNQCKQTVCCIGDDVHGVSNRCRAPEHRRKP